MKASQALHPTDQTLQSYGLGKLDDLLVEVVSNRLDSCSDCRSRVAELAPDSFLGKLRHAQGQPESPEPAVSSTGSPSRLAAGPSSSAAPLSETLPPGLAEYPDYEILRELGRGGMGVVYLARNKLMGRHEVLKVVGSHLLSRPGVLDRFLGEIRNAAELHHPNIVTAYSALRFDDSLGLAMEYVEGLDLDKTVRTKGPLSVVHACYFIQQAAMGLQHAHEHGMVHRDIKPGNLMLVRLGNRAVIKILDFGLAKVRRERTADGTLTAAGQLLGTPDFIAPEQINDARQADIRADIYSLGCTLYFLLTGNPPFQATTLYEIYQAHHSMDAPLLNLVRPDVPMELAVVVATMMAKEPERRFQTPREVAQALAPFLKKENPATQPSKPELSLANATTLHQQSAGTGRVSSQPVMIAGPASTPVAPKQAGSDWETLIETRAAEGLSEEVRTLRAKSRSTPPWLWPLAAAGLLLVGLGVGWGLRTESGTNKAESVPPPSLASTVKKAEPAAPARKQTEVLPQEGTHPVASALKPGPPRSMPGSGDDKVASGFKPESTPPVDKSPRDGADATVKEAPADAKPVPSRTAAAPKAKAEAEPAPADASPQELLLVKRGLKKEGMFYVVVREYEVVEGWRKVVPYWKATQAAWFDLSQALQVENYALELDDKRINLQAYINTLNAELGTIPNTIPMRPLRQQYQQEIQGSQVALGDVIREYAIVIKRVVAPQKKQALIDEFKKRRVEFLEESDKLKPTFDRVTQEYSELLKDDAVTNAIRVLKETANANVSLGPSKFCKLAFSQVKEAQQVLSYNPEGFRKKPKPKLKQTPKGKTQSMPSGKTDAQ